MKKFKIRKCGLGMLDCHLTFYKNTVANFDSIQTNYGLIDQLTAYFQNTKVEFIKYANSFQSIDQSGKTSHAAF